jgi:hypothetical protein
VRRCGLRREWRGAGRHVRTGGGKGGDVIAVVISILLCLSANGSGRVRARGCDKSQVDMRCQRRFWRVALARVMPTRPLAAQPRTIVLHDRGMGRREGAPVRRSTQDGGRASGDEAEEQPAHAPETGRWSILSTMHRTTQQVERPVTHAVRSPVSPAARGNGRCRALWRASSPAGWW